MKDPVNYVGPVGLVLLCAGIWGRWGWAAAAIVAGAALLGLYLYVEVVLVLRGGRRRAD